MKTLAQKIVDVMSEVNSVSKRGRNEFQNYSYAKESDYIEAIRPTLIKNGIVVLPSLEEVKIEPIGKPESGNMLTSIIMKFTLINAENPKDMVEMKIPAQGADKSDKGVYKAITGAKKYFVSNVFLIPTNDDAEKDSVEVESKSVQSSVPAAGISKFATNTSSNNTTSKGGW